MKARITIALMSGILLWSGGRSVRADIRWVKSVAAAQQLAHSERKPMIVDCYTEWCAGCKVLDLRTFKDDRVSKLSRSFVALKVDAEGAGQSFADKHKVVFYPNILFLDSNGHLIHRITGFLEAPELSEEMQRVLDYLQITQQIGGPDQGASRLVAQSEGVFRVVDDPAPRRKAKPKVNTNGKKRPVTVKRTKILKKLH